MGIIQKIITKHKEKVAQRNDMCDISRLNINRDMASILIASNHAKQTVMQ